MSEISKNNYFEEIHSKDLQYNYKKFMKYWGIQTVGTN